MFTLDDFGSLTITISTQTVWTHLIHHLDLDSLSRLAAQLAYHFYLLQSFSLGSHPVGFYTHSRYS